MVKWNQKMLRYLEVIVFFVKHYENVFTMPSYVCVKHSIIEYKDGIFKTSNFESMMKCHMFPKVQDQFQGEASE